MAKSLILALLAAPACALAPGAQSGKTSMKLGASTLTTGEFAGGLVGNSVPGVPGSRFDFDPLRFSERATAAELVKYREAELKHGRVAMLAATGMLVSEVYHPLLKTVVNVPSIYAFQLTLQKEFFWIPLLAGIAAVEGLSIFGAGDRPAGWSRTLGFEMNDDYEPGSYGALGPWNKDNLDAAAYERKEVSELNNGRLAMIAVTGIVAQELVTNQPVMLNFVEALVKMQPQLAPLFL